MHLCQSPLYNFLVLPKITFKAKDDSMNVAFGLMMNLNHGYLFRVRFKAAVWFGTISLNAKFSDLLFKK